MKRRLAPALFTVAGVMLAQMVAPTPAQAAPWSGVILVSEAGTTYSHDARTGRVLAQVDGSGATVSRRGRLAYAHDVDPCHPDIEGCFGAPDLVVSTLVGTGQRVLVHNPQAQGGVSTPDWSPDGTRLVYSWNTPGERGLNIVNADGSGNGQLVSFCGPGTFSPDGRSVAFVKDGLQVVDPVTGAVRTVTADPSAQWVAPDWSPDGRFIVYSAGSTFVVVPAAGGEGVAAQLPATLGSVQAPVFSPDGRRIAFVATESAPYPDETTATRLYTANRDGSGLTAVAETYGQPTRWLGL